MIGTPTLGGSVTFEVDGPTGSVVVLNLGGTPTVNPTPGVEIEALLVTERRELLGVIPPSGTLSVNYPIAPSKQQGDVTHVQADVYLDRATILRTNSVPLVMR